jgi:hypothetical protein
VVSTRSLRRSGRPLRRKTLWLTIGRLC